MKLPKHLFLSSSDGCLYDTRIKDWHLKPPLRGCYNKSQREIHTTHDFKATLRHGSYAWPGGYPMFFMCHDGTPLCFKCAEEEFKTIISAIKMRANSGWRVVACDINYEDLDCYCDNCSERIESAYGDDDTAPYDPLKTDEELEKFALENFNPDGMSPQDIQAWLDFIGDRRYPQVACQWFPDRLYKYRYARNMWSYLVNKLTAMDLRLAGNIQTAIRYEDVCENIYRRMPKEVKW